MFFCTRSLFPLAVIVFMHSKLGDALKQGNCPENSVKCESGECIKFFLVCDGTEHCLDSSDESHALCHKMKSCPVGSFRCAYGGCIDSTRKCNGIKDCSDNSDERLTTCPGFKWLTKSAPPCSRTDFQCRNGECTSISNGCDGKVDCSDGSDESIEACYSVSCAVLAFRCAYGGCISSTDVCNNINNCADGSDEHHLLCNRTKAEAKVCTIPSIEGISFRCRENVDKTQCVLKPGSPVRDQDIVHFHCEKGFITNEVLHILFCSNEVWNREFTSLCSRACPPLELSFTDFSCNYKNKTIDCSASIPGTIATAVCKEGYSTRGKPTREFSCLSNAQWEKFDLFCEKICGILDPKIANEQSSIIVRHPWNVGIYVKEKGKYQQFCSGTLITPLKVLTAANCMVNQVTDRLRQLKRLRIAVGKYHNNFYHSQDENVQIREIAEIKKPQNYRGSSNNYYNDVAILKLSSAVEIDNHVMPVCIDKSRLYKLSPDRPGSIVGWHLSESSSSDISNNDNSLSRCSNMNEDQILKSGQLPYMPHSECSKKYLSSYLSIDKFCAFSPTATNVTSVCRFDSGAGLTFKINDVHYIYGIVSTLVNFTDIRLTKNFINIFTNLTDEENFKFILDNF